MRKERGSKSSGILGASWAIGSSFSPDPAVKFGQYVVMLKLSWAMLNRVEAICQICSAMLLALHPKTLSPSRTRILSELLRTILAPNEGQVQLSRRQVGCLAAALEPSWANFVYLGAHNGGTTSALPPPKSCPQWPCSRARINAATTQNKKTRPKRSPQWPCSSK